MLGQPWHLILSMDCGWRSVLGLSAAACRHGLVDEDSLTQRRFGARPDADRRPWLLAFTLSTSHRLVLAEAATLLPNHFILSADLY